MDKDIPESLRRYADLQKQVYDFGPKFVKEKFNDPKRSWENGFSNPRNHNEKSFRYNVYAFQGGFGETMQTMFVLNHAIDTGRYPFEKDIDLRKQPFRVGEISLLSTSVIDDQKRRTFGHAGLILSSPFENVLDMSPTDVGTNFAKPEQAEKKSNGLKFTLDELTEKTSAREHNEVRIKGKTESGEIKVIGFWYKADHNGEPLDETLYEEMRKFSILHGLPLVAIREPRSEPHEDHKAEINYMLEHDRPGKDYKLVNVPFGVGVNRGGYRYFYDFKNRLILKMDRDRKRLPVSKDDYQFFKNKLLEELSEADKEVISSHLSQMDEVYNESRRK